MKMVELPVPTPSATQVLIKVHAASLNPVDYKMPTFPVVGRLVQGRTVCHDGSGVIVALGSKVTAVEGGEARVGTPVFGKVDGGLAEYALAEASHLAVKPASVSHESASTVNVAGLMSLVALEATGLKPGSSVLVVGGSGGCGSYGVQIAKAMGAGKVTTVCGDANVALCKGLGADCVCSYSGGDEALVTALQAAGPFDCCYDTVTSPEDPDYERITSRPGVLRSGTTHVAINAPCYRDFARAALANATGLSFLQRSGFKMVMHRDSAANLARIADWMAQGKVRPLIDSTHPFSLQGVEVGYDRIASRHAKGKVVVKME